MHNPASEPAPPRILSFTTVYPNPRSPTLGLFVRSRLQAMAARSELKLIAPAAWIEYGRIGSPEAGRPSSPIPRGWVRDGNVEVLHPRWLYPPGGGALNAFFLFAWSLLPVLRLRRRFRFDLIDAHFGHPDGVAAAAFGCLLRVPCTITLRGNEIEHSRSFWRRMALAWAVRRAARVIAVSSNLAELARRLGAPGSRVCVIPNGVDSGVFRPLDRLQCRLRHAIPPDARLVISAGELIERKGHHRVIEALAALAAAGFDFHLWIAGGSGPEPAFERSLLGLPARLGLQDRVRFFGRASQQVLAELMSAADLLCLASTREGWPNVVNEALACGTPVVATGTGGAADMLASPEHGIVVPVGDPAVLREALRQALERRWDRSAIAAWGQTRAWTRVGEEVIEQARTIIGRLA